MNEQLKVHSGGEQNSQILFELFLKDISAIVKELGVDVSKFRYQLTDLTKQIDQFLADLSISRNSFLSNDRVVKGLCLADSWLDLSDNYIDGDQQRLVSTRDRFKLLCKPIETVEEEPQLYQDLFYEAIMDIDKNYVDKERSRFVNSNVLEIYPQITPLLELSRSYNETGILPFQINILKLSQQEFVHYPVGEGKLQSHAVYRTDTQTGLAQIYLPYDSPRLETHTIHEIIHSLSYPSGKGINEGFYGILGRGINEAITESKNLTKLSYPQQRYVLNQIFLTQPELKELVYQTYFGYVDRKTLTVAILDKFGPEGLIRFEFMASSPMERVDPLGNSALFDPQECIEFFSEGLDDPFLEVTKKTMKLSIKFDDLRNLLSITTNTNNDFWKNYHKPVRNIAFNLSFIFNLATKRIPLKDLFVDEWMLGDYNSFLDKLSDFNFEENEITRKELAELAKTTQNWSDFVGQLLDEYWSQNDKQPLYRRQPDIKTTSTLTPKQLESAYLKSQLMQNRRIV